MLSLSRPFPFGRALWSTPLRPRLIRRLDGMRVDDRPYQFRKPLLQFRVPRDVMQLHAVPLAPDQAGLAKNPEVLRERRFWDRPVADNQEIRAALRTFLRHNVRKHRNP